jgi:hypothetical protein
MFAISLSSCSRYNANFKLDRSVSAIHHSPPYFWDQWGWPPTEPLTVTHARAHWWTLDLAKANAFVSPGVNCRGELILSHGASRRRLGDNIGLTKKDRDNRTEERKRKLRSLSNDIKKLVRCKHRNRQLACYQSIMGKIVTFTCARNGRRGASILIARNILYFNIFNTFFVTFENFKTRKNFVML